MSKWQPIRTAPKDGRAVWTRGQNFGKVDTGTHEQIAKWRDGAWRLVDDYCFRLIYLVEWKPHCWRVVLHCIAFELSRAIVLIWTMRPWHGKYDVYRRM